MAKFTDIITADVLTSFSINEETKIENISTVGQLHPIAYSGKFEDLADAPEFLSEEVLNAAVADLEEAIDGKADLEHTQASSTITDFSTAVDARITIQKAANNGLATLDNAGKIPSSQLASIVITNTFVVTSQAEMLALTAETGDVAVRTDQNKSYILRGSSSSTLADWQELLTPTDSVLSVNGQTGTISLTKSDLGLSNVDNTSDANKPISTATQTALNLKQNSIVGAATTIITSDLTVNRALVANSSGKVAVSSVSETELGYLSGAQSNIQIQIDGKAASSHTQAASTITDFSTAVDARITLQKAANSGLATLDSSGKIPTSQLPALAITDTFVVASQAAMLALSSAENGDIAIRTDQNKSYILSGSDPTTLGNWKELLTPTDSVLSVNGYTGAVTITKSDLSLGNVDNTSDANKPISTATQTALNTKFVLPSLSSGSIPFASGSTLGESTNLNWDNTNNFLNIITPSLGVTQSLTSGLALVNTTAAASGAQQISPPVRWKGFGWKTNSTAASQSVEFRADVLPVQGTSNPSGNWRLSASINGGAFGDVLNVSDDGRIIFSKTNSSFMRMYPSQDGSGTYVASASGIFIGTSGTFGSSSTLITLGAPSTSGFSATSGTSELVRINGGFGAGAGSADFRSLNINYTINNSGAQTGVATGLILNATETALNGMTHNLLDLRVGGASKLSVTNAGGATFAATVSAGSFAATATGYLRWLTRTLMYSPADGQLLLQNAAATSFSGIKMGGTSSSFLYLKSNGTALNIRLADDSADAPLTAGATTISGLLKVNLNALALASSEISGTAIQLIGADATAVQFQIDGYGGTPGYVGRRSAGTSASPSATLTGTTLNFIGGRGYGATGWASGSSATIGIVATETWTDSAQGTKVIIGTTPIGSTTRSDRLTIDDTAITATTVIKPQQSTTAAAPAYQKGAIYFDTTLNKLRVGGATAWETITSS